MDIRTLFIDEPSFGTGSLSVASTAGGDVHIELAVRLAPADRIFAPPADGAYIVAASSTGLARLSNDWGLVLALGVTRDPDAFIADLNACRHGDRVLRAGDGGGAFDVEPGFDDHYAVAPMLGEVPEIAGMAIRDGNMFFPLPDGMAIEAFERKFTAAMAPHEFEAATRAPGVVAERYSEGLPLLAMPRFTEVTSGRFRRANRIYRLDLDTLAVIVAETVKSISGCRGPGVCPVAG